LLVTEYRGKGIIISNHRPLFFKVGHITEIQKETHETMAMMTKYLAILVLVSQATAFTVVPQSRSSLSVSYLLLVEIQLSQAQSFSHPVSFHSAFRPKAPRLAKWWEETATAGQRSQIARIHRK
jgi:hypothetical protein